MSKNTKILRYDLERSLSVVFDELDELKKRKGTVNLFKILTNIDTDLLAVNEKAAMQDLLTGKTQSGKTTIERLKKLEGEGSYSIDSLIEGNYKETFEYDASGEIVKHTATGDISFVTTYSYGALIPKGSTAPIAGTRVLTSSSCSFSSTEGRNIVVQKTYHYDAAENIVEINTSTTVNGAPLIK